MYTGHETRQEKFKTISAEGKQEEEFPERQYTERITFSVSSVSGTDHCLCQCYEDLPQLKTKLPKQVKENKSTPGYIIKKESLKKANFKRSYIRG